LDGKGISVEQPIEIKEPDKDLCDLMARLSEEDKETLATQVLRFAATWPWLTGVS
jgi:hypothetical protein